MPLIIRALEPSDYEAIQAIYAGQESVANSMKMPFVSKESWRQRFAEPDHAKYRLVAELDGLVVAEGGLSLCVGPHAARRRHAGYLAIFVHNDYIGQGIGSRLMEALLDSADNWLAFLRVELQVYADNIRAIRFYEKFGFVLEGTYKAYAFRNGRYADMNAMARLHPKLKIISNAD